MKLRIEWINHACQIVFGFAQRAIKRNRNKYNKQLNKIEG
jgi:hypothetical protein